MVKKLGFIHQCAFPAQSTVLSASYFQAHHLWGYVLQPILLPHTSHIRFITDNFSFSSDTETGRQSRQRNQIAQYARYANLAMVRHISGSSSKIRAGTHGRFGNPLYRACRGCFEDIVDFLLDRDVDHHDRVLTAANRAGCGGIMRKVLKRKITFETDFAPRELLVEIIKREDGPMLQLILEHGYMVTLGRYEEAMEMAVAHGLESMIDCLNGLEIVEDPPYFSERYNH